jgi:hypothetical protein
VPGKSLLRFAEAINTHDLVATKQAIEKDGEQVNQTVLCLGTLLVSAARVRGSKHAKRFFGG